MADLGDIARYSNALLDARKHAGPIRGIGALCATLLQVVHARSSIDVDDRSILRAVHGFAAEAAIARKILELGNQVEALDERIPYYQGRNQKEVDILAYKVTKGGVREPWVIEVKSSWAAVEHSLREYRDSQLIGLCRVAAERGAVAALIINEGTAPGSVAVGELRRIVARCKELTGRELKVLNASLTPVL